MLSNDIIPIIGGDEVDKLRDFINQIYIEHCTLNGKPVLRLIATHNSANCFQLMLDSGDNFNIQNRNKRTILHSLVCRYNANQFNYHIDYTRLYYVFINVKNDSNMTPIARIFCYDDKEFTITKQLMIYGAEFIIANIIDKMKPFAQSVLTARELKKHSIRYTLLIWSKGDSPLTTLPKDIIKMIVTILSNSDIDSWIKN
jgi:ankyrin repeat protein